MTEIEVQRSLVELAEQSDEGKREMAAARAEVRVSSLLQKAVRITNTSQSELAQKLGVSEGRVSQVLNAEGHLRISTVARYLRAMGYALQIDAEAIEDNVPSMKSTRRARHGRRVISVFGQHASSAGGKSTVVLTDRSNMEGFDTSNLAFLGVADAATVKVPISRIPDQTRGSVTGTVEYKFVQETKR